MAEQYYVNGYVYSTGVVELGAPCVAPIVEFTNSLCEPAIVTWQNRVVFTDDDVPVTGVDGAVLNQVVVAPGDLVLITNLYPSSGWKRSLLTVETASTGLDAYVFWFGGTEAGYNFCRVPYHWCRDPATQELTIYPDYVYPSCKQLLSGSAYRPSFNGNSQPKWRDCLFWPVSLLPLKSAGLRLGQGQGAC